MRGSRSLVSSSRVALGAALLAGSSFAQSAIPEGLSGIEISYCADPVLDSIFRCSDADLGGNYNQPGETLALYADVVDAPLVALVELVEPRHIAVSPDDTVFVADSARRIVLALNDVNENGTANELGEHWVYFDGSASGNAAGLVVAHTAGLSNRAPLGAVWLASSSLQTGEFERVLRLEDRTLDLDANDANEASVFVEFSELAPGDRNIAGVREGVDGAVYVLDTGAATPAGRGIYRLEDLDGSGAIDAAGEVTAFFLPPAQGGEDWVALDQDDGENWYLLDRGNGRIWRGHDADASGSIDGLEMHSLWQLGSGVDWRDIGVTDEGGIFLGVLGAPGKIEFAADMDLDGTIGSGESLLAYDVTVADVDIDSPVAVAVDFHEHAEVGDAFCTAASIVGCPCNNGGAPNAGCANSTGLGAILEGEGSSGVGNDDLELHALQLPPNAAAVAFYGMQQVGNGNGQRFYDGLRCVSGSVRRLGLAQVDALGNAHWGPGLVQDHGFVVATTYNFQVWYRDPSGPCATNSNFSNGLSITFDP